MQNQEEFKNYKFSDDTRYQSGLISLNQPDSMETRLFYFQKFFKSIEAKDRIAVIEEQAKQLIEGQNQLSVKEPSFADIIKLGAYRDLTNLSRIRANCTRNKENP